MTTPKTARDYAEQYATKPHADDFGAIQAIENAVASLKGVFELEYRNEGHAWFKLRGHDRFTLSLDFDVKVWPPRLCVVIHHPMFNGPVHDPNVVPEILGRILAPYMPKESPNGTED